MWWVNKYLKLQEWEEYTKSNKIITLDITILVPNKNPILPAWASGPSENFGVSYARGHQFRTAVSKA